VNYQPTLQGQLVTLRPLRAGDFDALYQVAKDPLIWEQHPNTDRWQEPVFREFFRVAIEGGKAFLVLDAVSGTVIGSTRFHNHRLEEGEIEIGWTFLARSHWGGAWNREMKEMLLAHAFQSVSAVVFLVGPNNQRSQRALEKIGAERIGTRVNDAGLESVVFRKRRQE
jgi:N-acetyltransferase